MNDTDEAFELLSKFKNQDGNYPPEFKKAQYSAQISKNSTKGTKVVQATTEDNLEHVWLLLN